MAENHNIMQALQALIKNEHTKINTAINAVIENYDQGLADVKPIPQQRFIDGGSIEYPVIPQIPVVWPRFAADQAGVKGPVKPGDQCLLIFCQQATDGSDDLRRFSLIDAYCIVGAFAPSQNARANNNQHMQLYFGEAYIALTAEGKLLINAPGGVEINAPNTLNNGRLHVQQQLSFDSGLSGTGSANIQSGDIQADGISFKSHIHQEHDGPMTGRAR